MGAPDDRIVIIGNSGSGKSTLAQRIATALRVDAHDLDLIHWSADGHRRDEAVAIAELGELASGPRWVIEGVYGWLAEPALARATTLVWLDLPWRDCRDGLLERGLRRGMTQDDQRALLIWAEAYWARQTSSSWAGHEALFQGFPRSKIRLETRIEAMGFGLDMMRSDAAG